MQVCMLQDYSCVKQICMFVFCARMYTFAHFFLSRPASIDLARTRNIALVSFDLRALIGQLESGHGADYRWAEFDY